MGSDFRFSGYRRRIARRFVHTVVPRWSEFDTDLTEDTLNGFENTVRHYPPFIRFGIGMMLLFIEFGGPLTFTGIVPFSFLSPDAADRRLHKLLHHRIPVVRNVPKLLVIICSLWAYSRPDVERHLGAERRPWRARRKSFRDQLIKIDEGRVLPPTPNALEGTELTSPEGYLFYGEDTVEGEQT